MHPSCSFPLIPSTRQVFLKSNLVGAQLHTYSMKTMLSPIELKVLALVSEERSGREVARLYGRQTGSRIPHGTLYSTLRRMRERGWVQMRRDRELDPRIRLFVATAAGTSELEQTRSQYASLSQFGQEDEHA